MTPADRVRVRRLAARAPILAAVSDQAALSHVVSAMQSHAELVELVSVLAAAADLRVLTRTAGCPVPMLPKQAHAARARYLNAGEPIPPEVATGQRAYDRDRHRQRRAAQRAEAERARRQRVAAVRARNDREEAVA